MEELINIQKPLHKLQEPDLDTHKRYEKEIDKLIYKIGTGGRESGEFLAGRLTGRGAGRQASSRQIGGQADSQIDSQPT